MGPWFTYTEKLTGNQNKAIKKWSLQEKFDQIKPSNKNQGKDKKEENMKMVDSETENDNLSI